MNSSPNCDITVFIFIPWQKKLIVRWKHTILNKSLNKMIHNYFVILYLVAETNFYSILL